jgi:tRNA G10  N-methylase Trm11
MRLWRIAPGRDGSHLSENKAVFGGLMRFADQSLRIFEYRVKGRPGNLPGSFEPEVARGAARLVQAIFAAANKT